MVAKTALLFCAQALLVQCISAQYIGYNGIPDGLPCGATPFGVRNGVSYAEAPLAYAGFAPASSGGGFPVRSVSPIAPTGVFMTSENVYEGPLSVSGAVPFLAAVALEGALPTAGTGAISYGCGRGDVAMLSEGVSGYALAGPYGYGAGAGVDGYAYGGLPFDGVAGPAYGYNRGCGCGPVY